MLLREADRTAVRKHFEDLAGPVSATVSSQRESPLPVPGRTACQTCPTTEAVPLTVVEPLEDGTGLAGQGTSVLGARGEEAFLSAVAEVGAIANPHQDPAP